ncbi:MAG: 30S ribosomal protein S27e [Candidatus Bilamarchaeaceae archaeon]
MASKFLRVKCKCGTERVVFNKSTTEIKCDKCGTVLVSQTGGKAVIHGDILEELG